MAFKPGDYGEILRTRAGSKSAFGAAPGTVAGTPVAAKIKGKLFQDRQKPSIDEQAPSDFEIYRNTNPDKMTTWGQRFMTTSLATQFQAPPPPSPEEVA